MKRYKYERYTIRLTVDMANYIKAVSAKRGIAPTALIKTILSEYKERDINGR